MVKFPLVGAYLKHGRRAIILAAAFADCDFVASGATHQIGWEKVISAVSSVTELTPENVTSYLKTKYPGVVKGSLAKQAQYWSGVTAAMGAVERAVSDAVYYCSDGSIRTATKEVAAASPVARAHMEGKLNSRTAAAFSGASFPIYSCFTSYPFTRSGSLPRSTLILYDAINGM